MVIKNKILVKISKKFASSNLTPAGNFQNGNGLEKNLWFSKIFYEKYSSALGKNCIFFIFENSDEKCWYFYNLIGNNKIPTAGKIWVNVKRPLTPNYALFFSVFKFKKFHKIQLKVIYEDSKSVVLIWFHKENFCIIYDTLRIKS